MGYCEVPISYHGGHGCVGQQARKPKKFYTRCVEHENVERFIDFFDDTEDSELR